jgi:hypothetical protein
MPLKPGPAQLVPASLASTWQQRPELAPLPPKLDAPELSPLEAPELAPLVGATHADPPASPTGTHESPLVQSAAEA